MGMTRPALYYYVKSKDDLLAKLVSQVTEGAAAEIKKIAEDPDRDSTTKLQDIATLIARRRATAPQRFLVLVRSEAALPAKLVKANETAKRETLHHLTAVIT